MALDGDDDEYLTATRFVAVPEVNVQIGLEELLAMTVLHKAFFFVLSQMAKRMPEAVEDCNRTKPPLPTSAA